MRQIRWDAEAAIFWTELEVLSPEGVSMIVLTGMHPTEFGAVTIYCQDTKSHFDEFGPTFEAVIGSVKVDTQFRYRERSLFERAAESITLPALIGSGCAFALYGILLRRRRAKRNSPDYVSVRSSGAVWKIVLGFVLVFGHLSSLMHALDGDGWLQTSAEAQGYWFAWGLFVTIGLLLLYSAAAALHSKS
jgi:H+/Cl- antiporter ClcA